jgi:hypothetical protein
VEGKSSPQTDQKLRGKCYTLIVSERSNFGRKIIEKKSRLELSQLEFQFLAEERLIEPIASAFCSFDSERDINPQT